MPSLSHTSVTRFLLHLIFFLSGIAAVLIGQLLPIFAERFVLTDLQLGYFFPAQFAGSIFGTFITSRLARNNRFVGATVAGGIAMAAGMLLFNLDSFEACVAGFFINGIGIGLTLPAINMIIIELSPGRTGPALSILNLCWGVGAIICKPFVDLFSSAADIGLTTYVLSLPLVVASAVLALGMRRRPETETKPVDSTPADQIPIWRMPIAWMIAFFNFIHVGVESGMGGWLTTYTGRLEGEPIVSWASPILLYFLFFVLGRAFAPVLFRFLSENGMLFLGLAIMIAGMFLILTAGTVAALSLGAVTTGFGTSWIFPTNVSRFSRTFGSGATRRATPLFMAGTVGAAVVTWLIGYLSDRTGDLRSGMLVMGISVIVLAMLQTGLWLHGRSHRQALKI